MDGNRANLPSDKQVSDEMSPPKELFKESIVTKEKAILAKGGPAKK